MKSPLGRLDHAIGPHFQNKLASLVLSEKPELMIETGLETGYGAEHYLAAMDTNGRGRLISIDPTEHRDMAERPLVHPRFTWVRDYSYNQLVPLFLNNGSFDIFLHDSDHGAGCQTFEYELAWYFVRPGGIIASDDPFWGMPPHWAWTNFLKRHGLGENGNVIGNAQWVRKPDHGPKYNDDPEFVANWADECYDLAKKTANEYAIAHGEGKYL